MDPSNAKELSQRKCKPCEGGVAPLSEKEVKNYLRFLPGWEPEPAGGTIRKLFVMKHFMAAVQFIEKIADVAEGEDHHPDLHLTGYRRLLIELSTHAIKGLSENDFILAAKLEDLPKELK